LKDGEMTDQPQFPEAELARLADGTLPAEREAELRARMQGSSELASALEEQRRAVSMLHAIDEPAPDSLRARIEAETGAAGDRRRRAPARWRPSLVLPAATALALVAALLVVVISGSSSAPTVPQTVRVTLAAATLPAPAADPADQYVLQLGVDGIRFPNWRDTLGWRAAGARTDTLDGRHIVTVFYTERRGRRVGYAIVAGKPLSAGGGTSVRDAGVTYTFQRHGATRLVTWVRSGHTCVIAGQDLSDPTLLALANADAA
jgi:hypothetical protein